MSFRKVEYRDKKVVISAKNLNDIQDAIIELEKLTDGVVIVNEASGSVVSIPDATKRGFMSFNIYGKTTQDGTPTPAAPVELVSTGASGAIKTTVCGANLLPGLTEGKIYTRNNLTLKVYVDRCVCSGTPNLAYAQVYIASLKNTLKKGVYRVAGGQNGDGKVYLQVIVERGGEIVYHLEDKTFQIYGDEDDVRVSIQTGASTAAIADYVFYPIVHVGSTPIPYEPHKAQSLTVSTPNGLPGIPVTSGGNYTDANGQQWICDEIDFERGVYVKRVDIREVTENAQFTVTAYGDAGYYRITITDVDTAKVIRVPTMCSHFVANYEWEQNEEYYYVAGDVTSKIYLFSNRWTSKTEFVAWLKEQADNGTPLTFVYERGTVIETPLSEEELAAYDALHTYRENTTVHNDAYAWMDLEYVMDAKKYIDSLVSSTILQATVE